VISQRIPVFIFSVVCAVLPLAAQPNVLTWKYDNTRLGVNASETTLTPANVNSTNFGLLFRISPNAGKPDPYPLYVSQLDIPKQGKHNVIFMETEQDFAFAFDADTGAQLWKVNVLPAGETPSDRRNVGSVTPVIGITATPVIDLAMGPHGTMYLVAMSKDGSGNYHHRLHALDITTGKEEFGGPVEVAATYPGSGANSINGQQVFDPAMLKEQAALTLVDGTVVTTWSSHDDTSPYNGWVIGYDESNLTRTQVLCLTPNGKRGSIWMARGGPAVGHDGSIYMLVANGTFDTTLDVNGFPSGQDYGNSMLKLGISGGSYQVKDYFAMHNVSFEVSHDLDLGSGGIMLLPPMADSHGAMRYLVVGAGKDGTIYLAATARMGKFNPTTDQIYQEVPGAYQNVQYASPTFFNGNLYYATTRDVIRVFQMQNARINPTPIATSTTALALQGSNLIVSANGTSNGILWALEDQNNSANVLHAYDATNFNNGVLTELYNSTQAAAQRDYFGIGDHFVTPMVINGKVYAASANGFGVFGLLPKK
jgi:hypothetical protein